MNDQRSLKDQLDDLDRLAAEKGLYDAQDWLRKVRQARPYSKEELDAISRKATGPGTLTQEEFDALRLDRGLNSWGHLLLKKTPTDDTPERSITAFLEEITTTPLHDGLLRPSQWHTITIWARGHLDRLRSR